MKKSSDDARILNNAYNNISQRASLNVTQNNLLVWRRDRMTTNRREYMVWWIGELAIRAEMNRLVAGISDVNRIKNIQQSYWVSSEAKKLRTDTEIYARNTINGLRYR